MKKNMNKIVMTFALAGIIISLAGCQNKEAADNRGTQRESPESSTEQGASDRDSTVEQESVVCDSTSEQEEPERMQTTHNAGGVTIETEHCEGTSDPSDTSVYYVYSYDVPIVTIPGNETAQEAIQKDLQADIDSFLNSLNDEGFGVAYEEMPVEPSYQNLSIIVIRMDEKVISLGLANEGFNQGAHGWYMIAYRNYFTETGERITFDKLGENFREKAEELVAAKAAKMQEEEAVFYDNYEKSIPLVVLDGTEDINEVYTGIYGDDFSPVDGVLEPAFYVTDEGFGFESGQYVLQPYAGGIVDFEFTVEEFGDACKADLF